MPTNEQQVHSIPFNKIFDSNKSNHKNYITFSNQPPGCNFIKPVPAQTLTLTDKQGKNVHLDTGATVSYVKLSTVKEHNFK